jgi:hypothetical protein
MQGRNLQTASYEAKPSLSFSEQVWLLAQPTNPTQTKPNQTQPTNQNTNVERPRPGPSALPVHCFSTYVSRNNISTVLITDNGIKSSIFATIVTCADTVVISGSSPRYKNYAYNYQGCQPLDEKLSFFAGFSKGGNLQITLLTPDIGAVTEVTLLTSGSRGSL